ncbi:MAG TPA: helicase SNF [Spirochaetia bacterium]|nr:MAG: hypothetical protein A2Y30_02565 [Spirochaetes bacterium GWE1_32_154]HBI37443.1 helicase SNF [Spirochaetia bacterium]
MNKDIFSLLKNERDYTNKSSKNYDFFFTLHVIENEFVVLYTTASDRTTKIKTPDFNMYTGKIRKVLQLISEYEKQMFYSVSWTNTDGLIFLNEHPFIVHSLIGCTNLINSIGKDIIFSNVTSEIILNVSDEEGALKSSLLVKDLKLTHPLFINDEYLLEKNVIYKVKSVGDRANLLKDFAKTIDRTKFEQFLSIFFNAFPSITISFSNGYCIEDQISMAAHGILYIENIDIQKNLFLRVLLSVPGADPFIINDYGLDRVITINHHTKTIKLVEVDTSESSGYFDIIEKRLHSCEMSKGIKNGYKRIKSLFIISPVLADEFLKNELSGLLENYDILGEEKLEFFEIRKIKPKLITNFSRGINYFEGAVLADIDGQIINIFDLLEEIRKKTYITLADNKKGIINRSYIEKLQRIFKKDKENALVSFFDIPLMDDLFDEEQINTQFFEAKEFYKGFNQLSLREFREPIVTAQMRHYQTDGYKWMKYLYDYSLGGCLADDMGLGKTLQSIALLSTVYPDQKMPSLVVVPKSLLFNWRNELNKFAPGISYSFFYGSQKNIDEAMKSNIVITTYETVRSSIDIFHTKDFHIIILDESQKIKNLTSALSKSVMKLKAEKRFALSGTPVENHLGELYALFKFINPGMFGSEGDFQKKYLNPIQKENNSEILNELKKKIYPFILRRLKKDVLTELPEKIEQEVIIEMNDEHRAYYEKRRDFLYKMIKENIKINGIRSSQFYIFQALNELRQIASMPELVTDTIISSTKKESLLEQLEEIIDNGHKALIFANYLGILEIIEEELNNRNIDFIKITGQTKNRQELVDKFQNDEKCSVFLATLKTGGVGLNLTAADYVFIYDPWWNSASENQAIDRAHRMGQKNTVFSYKLITKGTIEEKIVELQRSKNDLINSLLSADGAGEKTIKEEDLEFLLGSNS